MPDWLEITIDDDDPRYAELLEQQAEDRRRWAASPQARAEMEKMQDRSWPRPDWHVLKDKPYFQRIIKWTSP